MPYPFATADHQAKNAEHFVRAGGAIMVRELDLGDVPDIVRSLLDDPPRLERMREAMLRAAKPDAADEIAEELIALARLTGARGAAALVRRDRRRGLSAYAQLARAWGAEVGGWDRSTRGTWTRCGSALEIGPEPVVPEGWEVVVSSAYPAVPGRPRGEFLAELVALRRSIVVAGAHGKGTTAAMIAFVLHETGRDPAWVIGSPVPQLGANAGAGEGWLVVEGDESDRSVFGLPAEIAVVTNVDLDHHTEFRSLAELEDAFAVWSGVGAGGRARRPAVRRRAAVPGEHNRLNAGAALAALELAGVARDEAAPVLARFTGTGRRFEVSRPAASRSSTTTATIRPSWRRRSPRRASCIRAGACARSSSRTSTRARATSRRSSRPPLRAPTTSPSRTSTRRASSPCRG